MSKYFKVELNKSPLEYNCGEKMIFNVDARENCEPIECKYVRWWLKGDDGKKSDGIASCPFTLESSCERPGYVYLICKAYNFDASLDESFDVLEAGAGAEVEKLEYCAEIPADFNEFWQETVDLVKNYKTEVILKDPCHRCIPAGFENYECYEIALSTPLGNPARGFLTYPKDDKKHPLIMEYNGYTVFGIDPRYHKDSICLYINCHGLENPENKFEYLYKYEKIDGYGFIEEENKAPKTTFWYKMMIRDLTGVKYGKTLPNWDKTNLIIRGGSQGALQATTVAANTEGVTGLDIFIPWFCNINGKNHGYMEGWSPKVENGLMYFDTVAQGSRLKCPVKITAYLGDYCCPPSTITTLYNTIKSEKQVTFIQAGTHGYRPPEQNAYVLFNYSDNKNNTVEPGTYKHYKGNYYEVLFTSVNSETHEKSVVYKALYGEGKIWSRPISMWNEYLIADGKFQKRFTRIK